MGADKAIWSVGGGKGGIGKSVATANIGCALARAGREVILVDADLGGANLHTYFGVKYPATGLDDFLKGRIKDLGDTAVATELPNLKLVCGAGEFLGIANPAHTQKLKLIKGIKNLSAEFIIVDLGAGSSYNVLDFFALSNEGIVVIVPEPAAIQNAYIFLKSFVYRRLQRLFTDNTSLTELIKEATDVRSAGAVRSFSDLCARIAAVDQGAAQAAEREVSGFRPRLLLNMAASKEDIRAVEAFKNAARTFLGMETDFLGTVYSRSSVRAAARRMRPFMLDPSAVDAQADMALVLENLLNTRPSHAVSAIDDARPEAVSSENEGAGEKGIDEKPPKQSNEQPNEQKVLGFNDNVKHAGTVFHVQTEAQGGAEGFVETIIYHGGRIFFSKRTMLKDVAEEAVAAGLKEFSARQHRAAIAAIKTNRISMQG